jgi:rhodanese-related sulfurtransferase
MSNISLSNLEFISRESLAQQLRASKPTTSDSTTTTNPSSTLPSNLAVIDVRDSDHVGGHIRGSTWLPSNELDYKMPELLRTMKDKDIVVFHCALSQQRGPSAALRYLREREKLGEARGERGQKVVVLKGGFTEWQEKYGRDEGLTEGWERGIWEFGT